MGTRRVGPRDGDQEGWDQRIGDRTSGRMCLHIDVYWGIGVRTHIKPSVRTTHKEAGISTMVLTPGFNQRCPDIRTISCVQT